MSSILIPDRNTRTSLLSFSIFCEMKDWHTVVRKAVVPIIDIDYIRSTFIEFSSDSGYNIRLSVECEEVHSEDVAISVNMHLCTFFSSFKINPFPIALPLSTLFLPFPTNSIQNGLYKVNSKYLSPSFANFSSELQKLICSVLAEDVIDDVAILTFAFYLNLCLGKGQMRYTGNYVYVKGETSSSTTYTSIRDNNKAIASSLQEIFIEIFNSNDDRNAWWYYWAEICKSMFHTKSENLKEMSSENDRISSFINRTLGLTKLAKSTLYHFLTEIYAMNDIKTVRTIVEFA